MQSLQGYFLSCANGLNKKRDGSVSMDRNLLCKECRKEIMNEAPKHCFICRAKHIKEIHGIDTLYFFAMRDYSNKEAGHEQCRAFPKKNKNSACARMLDDDYFNTAKEKNPPLY
jgi:hypothetical protein